MFNTSHLKDMPFFIAEISANHGGSLEKARNLIQLAADAGATAVKFQTYTAETMTLNLDSEEFAISSDHNLWAGRNLYSLYQEAHTPWEWHPELFEMCRKLNLIPFSSPFDLTAVDFLEELDCPIYKISSMETSDHELIERVASTGKELIISTGATYFEEIIELVDIVKKTGNDKLTLLVCTSSYPASPQDANLMRIKTLQKEFNCNVGLSDHTLGIEVSLAAIALGARVIEKHFIGDRRDGGPDAAFSLEPKEFAELIKQGKNVFSAIGNPDWKFQHSEMESRRIRRSLFITRNVKKGEVVSRENVRAIRPGHGCSPKFFPILLGKKFKSDYEVGKPLNLEMCE